ncbi:DUF2976 domain-containing protein [Vibrio sp. S11_S32]|uniref:DUF2976 domain-containing protein n=1 Tax=Vibrio sp. S11_S32 TaxID=2720225 RepID=UPI00168028D2|nr:DUF2976 domain-containing protein [Vibrio sp. S11_S32]MBD1577102.1 DUF2976 domain-containing protein [Vibrio sp. S11_S32]
MKRLNTKIQKFYLSGSIALFGLLTSNSVLADSLPTIDIPDGGSDTDYIGTTKNIMWGLFSLVALVLCAMQFFASIDGVRSKFTEWQKGQVQLSELVGMVMVSIGLLAFSVFLLTQLSDSLGFDFT